MSSLFYQTQNYKIQDMKRKSKEYVSFSFEYFKEEVWQSMQASSFGRYFGESINLCKTIQTYVIEEI